LASSSQKDRLYLEIAIAYFNVGKFNEALSYFQSALNSQKLPAAYAGAALCYAENRMKFDKAVVLARRALTRTKSWDYYLIIGWVYFRKADHSWAIESYDNALKAGGDQAMILFYRGIAELKLREFGNARADFEQVVQLSQNTWYSQIAQEFFDLLKEAE